MSSMQQIMTVVSESVCWLSAASPNHGSGESKSDSESGEVKVGRISGQMDGWIDLLVGGNGDPDGKGGEGREEEEEQSL